MTPASAWLLCALREVESSLAAYPVVGRVRILIRRVEAFARPLPRPRAKKPQKKLPEGLGRELPPPPRARPLHARLRGHLHLVVSNPHPEPSRGSRLPPDPVGEQARQASGSRSLLLEIVRRAAFDWVLYRASSRIDQRMLAEDAYTWLFLEEPGHPNWKLRAAEDKQLTSFLSICEQLDVDVERMRRYIRTLTPNRVMSSGRPPENSRPGDHTPDIEVHASVPEAKGGAYDFDGLMLTFDFE